MIEILLLVIIFLLAPWLVGVVLAAAAVYGAWVLVVAVAGAAALVILGIALAGRALFFPKKTAGDVLAEKNKEFNRKYMEQANAENNVRGRQAATTNSERVISGDVEKKTVAVKVLHSPRMINCPHCTESIPRHSLWCPACGKDPKLIRN